MLLKRSAFFALLLPLVWAACGDDPAGPPGNGNGNGNGEDEGYAFVYSPPAGAPAITSMSVRGSFNNWGNTPQQPLAMTRQADGSWRAFVELDSTTTYQYKFFINGEWISDMCHDETWGHPAQAFLVHLDADGCTSDGFEGQNAVLTLGEVGLGFSHTPTNPAHVSIADDRLSIRFRARQGRVTSAMATSGADTFPMHLQLTVGLEEVWRTSVPEGTSSYSIVVDEQGERTVFGPYSAPADPFRLVSWVGDGVGYQIFPERFWNGDPSNDSLTLSTDEFVYNELWTSNGPTLSADWSGTPNNQHCCHQYFGGDLAGIVEKIGHLEALGVTLIYLNPIWHSGSAHGYDAFDYMQLAPEFGDSAMLRTFLDVAHGAGMRVMWDFVPNHVGLGFWAFQDAVANGQASEYWDWFKFHPDGNGLQAGDADDYDTWCFGSSCFGSLPKLQTANPEVFDHLIEVARHWTEFGFDGIRVDVPFDIHNRSTFFPAMRQATKSVNPEVYLIAEVWQRDPSWLQGDQFDALMNYALGEGVIERFARGNIGAAAAASEMALLYADYAEAASGMLFNLIASHDTDRLLTKMGGGELGGTPSAEAVARQRLASALQYAVPGVPVTYYGDECAMLGTGPGSSIHRARRTMQWEACAADPYGMVAHYTQLGGLKRSLDALSSSVIREYQAAGPVLAFLRGEPGPGEVLAVFNQSSAVQSVGLPAGSWTDAVTGATVSGSPEIGAYGWRFLVRS